MAFCALILNLSICRSMQAAWYLHPDTRPPVHPGFEALSRGSGIAEFQDFDNLRAPLNFHRDGDAIGGNDRQVRAGMDDVMFDNGLCDQKFIGYL